MKQRIRAIKNIGKITKAMKMVAASKMRNAQVAVESSRGIVSPFVRLFGDYPGARGGAAASAAGGGDRVGGVWRRAGWRARTLPKPCCTCCCQRALRKSVRPHLKRGTAATEPQLGAAPLPRLQRLLSAAGLRSASPRPPTQPPPPRRAAPQPSPRRSRSPSR